MIAFKVYSVLTYLQDIDDPWHVLEFGFFVICVHHKYCDSFHYLQNKTYM